MHTYQDYLDHSRRIGLLNHATNILDGYDGLLSVPENGNTVRAEQVAVMNSITHGLLTEH